MSIELLKQDMNGYGKRLNTVEVKMGQEEVKTKRNEEDIQDIWTGIDKLSTTCNSMLDKISQKNNALLLKIVFIFIGLAATILVKDLFLKAIK